MLSWEKKLQLVIIKIKTLRIAKTAGEQIILTGSVRV